MVTGEVSLRADDPDSWMEAFLLMDGEKQRYTCWDAGDPDNYDDEANAMTVVVPVTAGTHTFGLQVGEWADDKGAYGRSRVTAQYFTAGSAADQPARRGGVLRCAAD